MAATLDVCFRHRETLPIDAVISAFDGTPADISALTDDDIEWVISKSKDGPAIATLTIGAGITITNGPSGAISIRLEPTDQDDISPGRYRHECWVTTTEGTSCQFAGEATVLHSIVAGDDS